MRAECSSSRGLGFRCHRVLLQGAIDGWPGPKLCLSSQIYAPSARSASMNWRGQPLTGYEVVVNLIAGTTTRTGLTVHAELDNTVYPKDIKITDREMRDLETQHVTRHGFHGDWNYCVARRSDLDPTTNGRDLEVIPGSNGLPGTERQRGP